MRGEAGREGWGGGRERKAKTLDRGKSLQSERADQRQNVTQEDGRTNKKTNEWIGGETVRSMRVVMPNSETP